MTRSSPQATDKEVDGYPGERAQRLNGSSKNWAGMAQQLHSGILADVLDGFGIWGALDPSIVCLNRFRKNVLGRSITVRWKPARKSHRILEPQESTWDQVKNFLVPEATNGTGMVYVGGVEDGLLRQFALAGGFSATSLQKRKFEGMILGGAIRDAHVVKALNLPVWATNFTPLDTQGNYQVAEVGTWCPIGNVRILTGDWIFADESGVIVIPQDKADQVFTKAAEVAGTEEAIESRASSGEDVFDIVADVGHL
jgi:regulator of RNase E activity RraA